MTTTTRPTDDGDDLAIAVNRPISDQLTPTRHMLLTAAEAQAWLPVGSVIADLNGGFPLTRIPSDDVFDGDWAPGAEGDPVAPTMGRYRVLFIPIVETPALAVGDTVSNARQARSLPVPAIILDDMRGALQVWENGDGVREWTSYSVAEGLRDEELFLRRQPGQSTGPNLVYTVAWLPTVTAGPQGWTNVETTCPGGC